MKKNLEESDDRDQRLAKIATANEIRGCLRGLVSNNDPDATLIAAREEIQKMKSGEMAVAGEGIQEAIMMLGHERHYLVAESVTDTRWRPMVTDLAGQIQKEYGCLNSSETALAGLAAAAYYRSLRASRKINALLEKESIGMTGVQLIAQVSKEADRAYRQYLAAIETLRGRKIPQLRVNIQAKSAFFAENQTINAGNSQNYEENNDHQ